MSRAPRVLAIALFVLPLAAASSAEASASPHWGAQRALDWGTDPAIGIRGPELAVAANGTAVAAWVRFVPTPRADHRRYVNELRVSSGSTSAGLRRPRTLLRTYTYVPGTRLAINARGVAALAWSRSSGRTTVDVISRSGRMRRLSSRSVGTLDGLAIDLRGRVTLLTSTPRGLWLARQPAPGRRLPAPRRVTAAAIDAARLAVDSRGDGLVAWADSIGSRPGMSLGRTYLRTRAFGSASQRLGGTRTVASASQGIDIDDCDVDEGEALTPQTCSLEPRLFLAGLGADDHGRAALAWTRWSNDSSVTTVALGRRDRRLPEVTRLPIGQALLVMNARGDAVVAGARTLSVYDQRIVEAGHRAGAAGFGPSYSLGAARGHVALLIEHQLALSPRGLAFLSWYFELGRVDSGGGVRSGPEREYVSRLGSAGGIGKPWVPATFDPQISQTPLVGVDARGRALALIQRQGAANRALLTWSRYG